MQWSHITGPNGGDKFQYKGGETCSAQWWFYVKLCLNPLTVYCNHSTLVNETIFFFFFNLKRRPSAGYINGLLFPRMAHFQEKCCLSITGKMKTLSECFALAHNSPTFVIWLRKAELIPKASNGTLWKIFKSLCMEQLQVGADVTMCGRCKALAWGPKLLWAEMLFLREIPSLIASREICSQHGLKTGRRPRSKALHIRSGCRRRHF